MTFQIQMQTPDRYIITESVVYCVKEAIAMCDRINANTGEYAAVVAVPASYAESGSPMVIYSAGDFRSML